MPVLLLSLLGTGKSIAQGIVQWLSRRSLAEIGCIILCIVCGVQTIRLASEQRHSAKLETQLRKTVKARADDQAAYRKAQADAQAKNQATVARDKAERERITHEFDNYQGELASLRARLAQLLRAKAAQGASGQSDLPNVSPAPSGPDGSARVSIPPSLYVRGAELELQLERLQQWVAEQVKVDPNK